MYLNRTGIDEHLAPVAPRSRCRALRWRSLNSCLKWKGSLISPTALQALAYVHQAVRLMFVLHKVRQCFCVLFSLNFCAYTSPVPVSTEASILSQNVNWLSTHKYKHMKMAASASNTWPKRRNAIPICAGPSNRREGKKNEKSHEGTTQYGH